MSETEKIYSLDLMYNGTPMPFVIKTMEEIDEALGGIADNPHTHNYYTVIWPVNATGKHIIDFKEYPILPDHIFFVSPGQVHQIISNRKPVGYVILFSPEFLEKNSIRNEFIADLKLFQKSDETPPLPVSEKMASTLKIFAEQMLTAFHSHNDMFLETIGAYLKLFLIECNGHCSLNPGTNLQNIEVSKVLVKNFKALVEKNFNKRHQVKYYAESLNITPNYLNEVIKAALNIPAKDFLQNRLILEAKRMVVFTSKSAKEIGFELGFEDPSHFSKFFRSNTGQSLQEFKLSLKL
jgi:AraC-like DNA-binding protein